MPGLCDVTDFGLDDRVFNKRKAAKLITRPKKEIFDLGSDFKVYQVGDHGAGNVLLYNPIEKTIGYFMHYEVTNTKLIGRRATQTKLWRSIEEPKSKGVAHRVIFEYLLKEYPAIMSDRLQTERGQEFWIALMFTALSEGYRVVLANLNARAVHEIESAAELRLWYTDKSPAGNKNAWGYLQHHQALRFAIFAKD